MRHAYFPQKTYRMRHEAEQCISRPGWDSFRLLLSAAHHPVSVTPMPRCTTGAFTQDASISAGSLDKWPCGITAGCCKKLVVSI